MANDLKPYENITRVFWVKIELTENIQNGKPICGEIRDVISGEKCLMIGPCDIIYFILPSMQQIGIRIHWFWRIVSWLRRKSVF